MAQLLSLCLSYLHFGLHFKADWLAACWLPVLALCLLYLANKSQNPITDTEGARERRREGERVVPSSQKHYLPPDVCTKASASCGSAPFGNWGSRRGLFNRGVELQMSPSEHFSCLSHEHNQISAHRVQITKDSQTNIHSTSCQQAGCGGQLAWVWHMQRPHLAFGAAKKPCGPMQPTLLSVECPNTLT